MSTVTRNGSVEGFFRFMEERQAIYLKKEAGAPWPWTKDPILRDYYFCNVYREQDTVTKWIAQNWRNRKAPPEVLIFNMAVARFFNWPPTLKTIGWSRDWTIHRNGGVASGLIVDQQMGHKIFNNAYLIAGTDLKGKNKIEGVCDRLDYFWEHRKEFIRRISRWTLENVWLHLQRMPGIGPFVAYEIVTDLRHTSLLQDAPDIMTWANPGPGAIRGLQRIHGTDAIRGRDAAIAMMHILLCNAHHFTDLELEMRDIEMTLCEYDKKLRAEQYIEEGRPVVGLRKYRYGR